VPTKAKPQPKFKCTETGCTWEGKTKGALTTHVKKEHGGDDPVAAVRNAFGPGAPRPGGAWREDAPLVAAPSGIPSVDYAIGIGGVPRGTLIEIFGPPASGKTFTALAFSKHAMERGERIGFMDAERALSKTFVRLVDGGKDDLLNKLEYGQPPMDDPDKGRDGSGEAALETSRRYIATGAFGIWTVDSVHACTPRGFLNKPIGDPATRAALAQLMSAGCQVLEHVISDTQTVGIFVNHMKTKPGVMFGRDWDKPGGSAFDYYASIQLKVDVSKQFFNKEHRRIGHRVRVKVYKSKVAAPHAEAEYDLFYKADIIKGKKDDKEDMDGRFVIPGVDLESCWFSVLKEHGRIAASGGRYADTESGVAIGSREDVLDALRDENSDLRKLAHDIVYPEEFRSPPQLAAA
jgi:recombination protein RecA